MELEVVVEVEEFGFVEGFQCAPFFLCGTAGATGSVYETADAAHLQNLVLLRVGDVFIDLGQQLGSHALLDGFQNAEGIGHWRLAHADHFALFQQTGGFDRDIVHRYAAVLAGVGGNAAGLENAGCPEPFVYACFVHAGGVYDSREFILAPVAACPGC